MFCSAIAPEERKNAADGPKIARLLRRSARMQPTAQAVGTQSFRASPGGAKETNPKYISPPQQPRSS